MGVSENYGHRAGKQFPQSLSPSILAARVVNYRYPGPAKLYFFNQRQILDVPIVIPSHSKDPAALCKLIEKFR